MFDDETEQVLTHFLSTNPFEGGLARATWQHSRDTSAVWGLAIASSSDPSFVAPGAIPWLLLTVVGAQAGPTGGDKMAVTRGPSSLTRPTTSSTGPTDGASASPGPRSAEFRSG